MDVEGLSDMQAAVQGYIDIARVRCCGDELFAVVDDEGLLKDLDFTVFSDGEPALAGPALILGVGEDGDLRELTELEMVRVFMCCNAASIRGRLTTVLLAD